MIKKALVLCLLIALNTWCTQPPFLEQPSLHAKELLASMTLREKIGQLFMIPVTSIFYTPDDLLFSTQRDSPYNIDPQYIKMLIRDYHVGGLIFLFKSEPDLQRNALQMYQQEAKFPLLIGQDLEWGLSQSLDHDPSKVTRYPHYMTLGALAPQYEYLIYELGKEIGKECANIGVHINFAPVVDVNNNAQNPVIHDRSFGDNPQKVARLAALYARGMHDVGIIACAKHFPGHGDVNIDSHEDLPKIVHDIERLKAIEFAPFEILINAGVSAIMTAHLEIPALDGTPHRPSSMSHAIVTQLLKEQFHFNGLAISDGLGMKAITNHYQPGELELQAFLAGNDILLCPLDVPKAVDLIEHAIRTNQVSEQELDRRVLKILQAKEWAFAHQNRNLSADPDGFLVRPEAVDLQSMLYRKTITLVRNNLDIPFNPTLLHDACVLHIGGSAQQCCKELVTYCHVRAAMSHEDQMLCLDAARDKDTVIMLVTGMNKFAAKNFGIASNTRALLQQLKDDNKTVIAVVFGSPYSIGYFDAADAVMLAYAYKETNALWQAVIDVLNGTLKAEGIMPISAT